MKTFSYIAGALIAVAALAGTITTSTMAHAAPPSDNPGQPFAAITESLEEIKTILNDIE